MAKGFKGALTGVQIDNLVILFNDTVQMSDAQLHELMQNVLHRLACDDQAKLGILSTINTLAYVSEG